MAGRAVLFLLKRLTELAAREGNRPGLDMPVRVLCQQMMQGKGAVSGMML
jgi:hypothetical protein